MSEPSGQTEHDDNALAKLVRLCGSVEAAEVALRRTMAKSLCDDIACETSACSKEPVGLFGFPIVALNGERCESQRAFMNGATFGTFESLMPVSEGSSNASEDQ